MDTLVVFSILCNLVKVTAAIFNFLKQFLSFFAVCKAFLIEKISGNELVVVFILVEKIINVHIMYFIVILFEFIEAIS